MKKGRRGDIFLCGKKRGSKMYGVYSPKDKIYIGWFEFPKQAERFIEKKNSNYLRIVKNG